jgi:gliding motility associated protien GldN
MRRIGVFCLVGAVSALQVVQAQPELPQYNPNSINPIPAYEQLFRFRVWRKVDLAEKQNKGFFAKEQEISKLIIDMLKSGAVTSYINDSLKTVQPKAEFLAKLTKQEAAVYDPWNPSEYYGPDTRISFNGNSYESISNNNGKNPETSPNDWRRIPNPKASEYLGGEITLMSLLEDVIFDKRRSRLYYDIQGIGLSVQTEQKGEVNLGWFKYKDLEKIFRNNPERAIWINRQNSAEHKNFADAFLLRLFKGTIEKVENPENLDIQQTYAANGRPYMEAVWAMEWLEMTMMEKEHNLWEY